MASEDTHTRFWSAGFGAAADGYSVIYAPDFVRGHGVRALADEVRRMIREKHTSLLFIQLSSPMHDPFFLWNLKQDFGLMVVLFTMDDEFSFDWFTSSYATIADLVLATDHVAVARYRQAGINAHFLTMPIYIPQQVPPPSGEDLSHAVTFVGRVDAGKPKRAEFAAYLAQNGISLRCFSSLGTKDPLYLSTDGMYSVFRNSAINLNFSSVPDYAAKYNNALLDRVRGMKFRPLEILAAGGFCISEHSVSLEHCLEDGKDLVFFKTKTELIGKIQYYLAHQDEASRIATQGARKIAEMFSREATSEKLRELIRQTTALCGFDLYGEPHRLKVSRSLASSYIVATMSYVVPLFKQGRLRSFLRDVRFMLGFIRQLSPHLGRLFMLRMLLLCIYRFGREALICVRAP